MLNDKCPVETGNATEIKCKMTSKIGIVMLRLEDIFDRFSDEPRSIVVQKEKNGEEEGYECILQVRIWNWKKKCYSWEIYSAEREEPGDLVIRRVIWNLDEDEGELRENIRERRQDMLKMWPSIVIRNQFILADQANSVKGCLRMFDRSLEKGIIIHKNKKPAREWRDLEIRRLYDWGQIHLTWSPGKKVQHIEKKIKMLILGLDSAVEDTHKKIYSMTFIYNGKPEEGI